MRNDAIQNPQENVKKIATLIDGIGTAMLTSVDTDGSLHSRPMGTLAMDFDGTLWFFTRDHSKKVEEVERESHVNVAFVDVDDDVYVSLRGKATLSMDRERIEDLWNPIFKAWFPQGLDDPELALLRVDVERGEFWDPPSSTMVQLFGFAKSVLTGQAYEPGRDEHGRAEFR